ncbi:MAG: hypothetical protein WCC60_22975 [Ilumatobacteraceae bacterium]
MADQRPLIEKVLDLVLYAPVGLAVHLTQDVPTLVASGRTRVQERVQVARWVGEMAVTYGRRELEKRLTTAASEHHSLEPVIAGPLAVVAAHEPAAPPFEGYEHLAAAQIVQLLARLPHSELALIREYEAAHRARRTILAKLDQLLGS